VAAVPLVQVRQEQQQAAAVQVLLVQATRPTQQQTQVAVAVAHETTAMAQAFKVAQVVKVWYLCANLKQTSFQQPLQATQQYLLLATM
jgi:hypothetical protein